MRAFLFLAVVLMFGTTARSQDLLLTSEGDSLNVRITKVQRDYLYFTMLQAGKAQKTLMPIEQVTVWEKGFYEESGVLALVPEEEKLHSSLRLALSGGFGYQTAKIIEGVSSAERSFLRGLKSGYQFSGDVQYYFNEMFGAGLKGGFFESKNSADVYMAGGGQTQLTTELNIFFVGPTFAFRYYDRDYADAFYACYSIGYLGYRARHEDSYRREVTGSTLGFVVDLGYDFALSEKLALGLQLSALSGVLTSFTIDDGYQQQLVELEEDRYEGLGRIELSIGLRFNL